MSDTVVIGLLGALGGALLGGCVVWATTYWTIAEQRKQGATDRQHDLDQASQARKFDLQEAERARTHEREQADHARVYAAVRELAAETADLAKQVRELDPHARVWALRRVETDAMALVLMTRRRYRPYSLKLGVGRRALGRATDRLSSNLNPLGEDHAGHVDLMYCEGVLGTLTGLTLGFFVDEEQDKTDVTESERSAAESAWTALEDEHYHLGEDASADPDEIHGHSDSTRRSQQR